MEIESKYILYMKFSNNYTNTHINANLFIGNEIKIMQKRVV